MKSSEKVYKYISDRCNQQIYEGKSECIGFTTKDIADALSLQRTNVSTILNKLFEEGKVFKINSKPVLFTVNKRVNMTDDIKDEKESKEIKKNNEDNISFDTLIGANNSLKKCVQQAKAAILYPPSGLHSLILGPTGVGKTLFAELMYKFAVEKGVISKDSPFVSFNCADYANNPQLLLAHLFGSKKGTFTGADQDKLGIVDKVNGGILFLDEIHRLPSEGQEMLFMLIDKGVYTPLGDIDVKKKSKVLIICATTEDVNSNLLATFARRIPMTINIPVLKDRTLEERFEIICEFFKVESRRIGKEITVSSSAIRALLLYNCTGNIGQLKSDIQLGCANAFLKYASKGNKKIEIDTIDFSNVVKQGLLFYTKNEDIVDEIIGKDSKLSFSSKGSDLQVEYRDDLLPSNLYESIEKRIHELKERGIEEEDINFTMSFEIKNYFTKYIDKFDQGVNKKELSKIVDTKIISLVEEFFKTVSEQLKRIFAAKVFYGLCLHISSTIERIMHNGIIINHNLNEIIENYSEEYGLALILANRLELEFNVKIPADEVGFIAMFLCVNNLTQDDESNKPVIVVAMHGKSTASSMADVANKLVGGNNVYSYDMKLDESVKSAYGEIKDLIQNNHRGSGVIYCVDMGSLGMFGELISEETGIEIRVIDMVSTLIVIECARKALTSNDIEQICKSTKQSVGYLSNCSTSLTENYMPSKDNIIVTICITGEGSAVKLKNMIEEGLNLSGKDIQVVPVSANEKKEMYNTFNKLSKNKKIIAVVGTINPSIYGIPFIPTSELFLDKNYTKIRKIVDRVVTENYDDIFNTISKEFKELMIEDFRPLCLNFIKIIRNKVTKDLDLCKISGLILHLVCGLIKLIKKESIPKCASKDVLMSNYLNEFMNTKEALCEIEKFYLIKFSDDEICNILIIILGVQF